MISSIKEQVEKSKILIVDDQPKNIQVLASQLSDKGYHIEYSTSGVDALSWVKEEVFDLILLDVMMPEMDGYETCKRIKQLDQYAEVPVIFLTAKTEAESLIEGFNSGGVDYMTKPFNPSELFVRVANHLELSHSKRMLSSINKYLQQKDKEQRESVRYANRIQDMVLPNPMALKEALPNSFVFHKQRDVIGGDFYWVKEMGSKVLTVVGDCTGHGIPGAMLSVLCVSVLNSVLENTVIEDTQLFTQRFYKQFESYTHDYSTETTDGVDMAVCLIDKESDRVCLVSANLPIIVVSDEEISSNQDSGNGRKISVFENGKHIAFLKGKNLSYIDSRADIEFSTFDFLLNKNDKIYLFSDGIIDQQGGQKGKRLMRKNLIRMVANFHQEPLAQQQELFKQEISAWQGNCEQVDDMILVGLSN